ncbi:Ger(x)C family spore germination protein [Paenibacillus terrigena]|uniref:Ger(x)C family spore germination protein n=1 Tax=Paenibacillus terrigena TaxID=369333 RepID=UPI0028D49D21|nr:Ger(x)C family spore germination protein [Paenibacillus terrigena]
MKRICYICVVMSILLFIAGCWDQDLLKDARLLYGGGFDFAPNGKLRVTFVIQDVPAGEQQSPKNDIISAEGDTPMDAREHADDQISRHLRTYKSRFVLIGEDLAKQDIYPVLEVFYRDPKSALNARIGVAQGTAEDILSLKKVGNVLIAEEIDELIKSKEETTTVPKVTLEKIYPVMLDPGEDFALPYLMEQGARVDVSRIAMFHNNKLTGTLSPEESSMYLLLKNSKGKEARFTQNMSTKGEMSTTEDNPQRRYDFLTFNVDKLKRKMKLKIQSGDQITVHLKLKLKVSVIEYPKDRLEKKQVVAELNKRLSKEMTDLAQKTLEHMQKARCDGLGIGRQLMAFHPRVWKQQKEEWGSNYQNVKFAPVVQVEITKQGIIN